MDRLFVYGTLMRGEDREGLVNHLEVRPAHTLGRLWRSPSGYPALEFNPNADTVTGEVLELENASVLMVLDLYEGVGQGLFSRIKIPIQTAQGTEMAWAYVMNAMQLREAQCVRLKLTDWRDAKRRR
jgi:gamma-glutamylcyclotransferase (GGCT)/AIG2-like uncharacterized protein YtfP